ncbi:hypothetical protein K9M48_02485, partial [Candidatus Gracilibacteria bacterium]|nr:hypothetical protein [Candidatus Gracilibacteria bacterium]
SDGTASGTTGVFIEGLSGKVGANRFCDKNLTNCKKIDSIVTTGELTLYLTGSALVPYVMDDEINTLATSSLTCTNGQIPKSNGSTRSCQADTDTDKYFSTASFNTSNGIVTLSGAGGQSNVTLSLEGRYRTGSDIIKTDTNGASVLNGNIGLGITSDSSDRITIAGDMGLYGNIINIYNKFLGGSLFIKGGDGTSVIGVGGEGVDTAGGNIYIVGG